jgi:hypothetical protein
MQELPIGIYDVEVKAVRASVSIDGHDVYTLDLAVVSGPDTGHVFSTDLVLVPDSPKVLGEVFGKFRALGLTADFFALLPTVSVRGPLTASARRLICWALVGRKATFHHTDRANALPVEQVGGRITAPRVTFKYGPVAAECERHAVTSPA